MKVCAIFTIFVCEYWSDFQSPTRYFGQLPPLSTSLRVWQLQFRVIISLTKSLINTLMPREFFYFNTLDRSISYTMGIFSMFCRNF